MRNLRRENCAEHDLLLCLRWVHVTVRETRPSVPPGFQLKTRAIRCLVKHEPDRLRKLLSLSPTLLIFGQLILQVTHRVTRHFLYPTHDELGAQLTVFERIRLDVEFQLTVDLSLPYGLHDPVQPDGFERRLSPPPMRNSSSRAMSRFPSHRNASPTPPTAYRTRRQHAGSAVRVARDGRHGARRHVAPHLVVHVGSTELVLVALAVERRRPLHGVHLCAL